MTKGNIIDLIMYRNQRNLKAAKKVAPVSEELKAAIKSLIDRLRDSEPSKRSGSSK
jgi:hypothetical protein